MDGFVAAARQPHTKQCLWTMAGVGATMGIHLGDMAGALLFMKDSLNLTFQEQELVMGALYLSTGLAALCLGYAALSPPPGCSRRCVACTGVA
jgi:hypothetical protein